MARKTGTGPSGSSSPGAEEAGVAALAEADARVVAKGGGDLAVAGVDGEDVGGTVLEHAVGEAAGRGADVEAGLAHEVDLPVFEGGFELEAAAADVAEVGSEEAEDSSRVDRGAGLINLLLVDEDTAGEDESLGSLAGGCQGLVDEELVEADLHGCDFFTASKKYWRRGAKYQVTGGVGRRDNVH